MKLRGPGFERLSLVRKIRTGLSPFVPVLIAVCCVLGAGCGNRLALDNPGNHVPPQPEPLPSNHPTISLVGAVADATRLRVDWKVRAPLAALPEAALFVGTDLGALLAGTPTLLDLRSTSTIVEGLVDGTSYYAGLGVRASAATAWQASGVPLRVVARSPIYVDPNAAPGGDGSTPGTATNDFVLALFNAFVSNGGNVWIAGGDVLGSSFPFFTGVHVHGGFAPGFLLAERDTQAFPTRLVGTGSSFVLVQTGAPGPAIVDGLTLVPTGLMHSGVDILSDETELRGLTIDGCERGVKLRATAATSPIRVLLAGVSVTRSVLEGLSVDGAYDVVLEACDFDSNGNEGADFNHLVAPEGSHASLVARASTFTRNGTEGLDAHLAAPTGAGPGGGQFTVRIEDCDFAANARDGVRVDIDYETHPGWSADITLRGVTARANGAVGVHLDLDFTSTAIAHRILATSNGSAGFQVTSESFRGLCSLSSSALVGNFGPGAQASFGNVGIAAGNCIFSGNAGGGFVSDILAASAHSSIAYLQEAPWTNVVAHACVDQLAADPEPFLNAAREFGTITAIGVDALELAQRPMATGGSLVEIQEDGVTRVAVTIAGSSLVLEPMPEPQPTPARAAFYSAVSSTEEDWRLGAASIAVDAGMAPPGAPGVDAGIFAAPLGGVPGREAAIPSPLFVVAGTTPAWGVGLGAFGTIDVTFQGGTPDAASLASSVFVRDTSSSSVPVSMSVVLGALHLVAPTGGWQPGHVLELHPSLRSTAGVLLSVPLAIPLRP